MAQPTRRQPTKSDDGTPRRSRPGSVASTVTGSRPCGRDTEVARGSAMAVTGSNASWPDGRGPQSANRTARRLGPLAYGRKPCARRVTGCLSLAPIRSGARQRGARIRGAGAMTPTPVLGSCDADVIRASQLQHAVQDLDRHVHLSRPTLIRTRAQPVPDHALVA